MNALVRPRRGRVLAGVCLGLARRFAIPAWIVRLAFVLSVFLPGPQVIIYVVLWILMPAERAWSTAPCRSRSGAAAGIRRYAGTTA